MSVGVGQCTFSVGVGQCTLSVCRCGSVYLECLCRCGSVYLECLCRCGSAYLEEENVEARHGSHESVCVGVEPSANVEVRCSVPDTSVGRQALRLGNADHESHQPRGS